MTIRYQRTIVSRRLSDDDRNVPVGFTILGSTIAQDTSGSKKNASKRTKIHREDEREVKRTVIRTNRCAQVIPGPFPLLIIDAKIPGCTRDYLIRHSKSASFDIENLLSLYVTDLLIRDYQLYPRQIRCYLISISVILSFSLGSVSARIFMLRNNVTIKIHFVLSP